MIKPIKTGIIGFGLSGRVFHAPFIHVSLHYQLSKVYSSRKKEIKNLYPEVKVVGNINDILEDPDIDLVVVASPNTEHYPQTKTALQNGKHVIVEKPFITDIKQGKKLINLAKKQEKVLAVFQNRRWDGDFLTVKQILNSGMLGQISEYEAHFDRFRPEYDDLNWRSHDLPGGGVLFDLGPHLIDQAIACFGMPEAVYGDIRNVREKGTVDDTFEIILYYKNFRAKLKAGVLVKEAGPHFIIHGNKGSFVKYGLDPQEQELNKGVMPDSPNWGKDDKELYGVLNITDNGKNKRKKIKTLNGDYMDFYDNVYKAITNGEPLTITPETALQNIHVIHTAIESNKQRKILNLKPI